LPFKSRLDRIRTGVESGRESIADHPKDVPIVGFYGLAEDRIVPLQQRIDLAGMLLRQRCAALDVCEQEGDCSGGD
jgi:hypothetical protein